MRSSKAEPAVRAGVATDLADLPEGLRQELLQMQVRGEHLTHYEVLGLDATADAAAIRGAYLDRTRRFHPDAHYSRNLTSAKQVLNWAFQRISEAHAILTDVEERAAFDATLTGLSAHERAAIDKRTSERKDEERRAQERRRRLFNTKGFARLGAARKLYEDAQVHAEKGERGLAVQALKAARELDPGRKEIAERLQRIESEQQKARAQSMIALAKKREADQDWPAALTAYQAALQVDPNSATATLSAARVAVMARDFQAATHHAQRAVDIAPRSAEPKLLLAQAWAGLGQKAKAKASLNSVLEVNPDNKEARALLKSL